MNKSNLKQTNELLSKEQQPDLPEKKAFNVASSKKQENNKLIVEQVKETPFSIITCNGKHFLAIGRYRMKREFEEKDEAIKFAKTISWETVSFLLTVRDNEINNIILTNNKK